MNTTLQEVKGIVAGLLGVPEETLTPSTSVGEIPEWDSLAQLSIMTTLEETYNLDIDPEIMMEVATISDIARLIEEGDSESTAQPNSNTTPPILPVTSAPQLSTAAIVPPYNHQPIICTIMQRAAEHPTKTALIFPHDSINYLQLIQGSQAAAAWLQKRGVRKGDTIAIYSEKLKEFYFVYFGAHLLGAAVLNLDPEIKSERRDFIYSQTKPALSIGNVEDVDAGYDDIDIYSQPAEPFTGPDMEDISDIMFTTGTTGTPKGVLLTHRNITVAAYHINTFIGTNKDDIEVIALPICHSFGMGRSRCVLAVGGTVIFSPGFSNAKKLFTLLHNYKATGFAFVPAAWAYMQQVSGDMLAEYAAQLRYIEIGSAPMPEEARRHLMNIFPKTRICMHYGLTEASRSTFMEFHSESDHLDTCGRPSPGVEVAIFSEDGQRLPIGEEGEICIKGNHVVQHCLHNARDNSFYGDYFRSGDWGKIDSHGYVSVFSRKKDLINTGGKKVSPEEVETILNSISGIEESACVSAPDPNGILGEVVKAILVSDGTERPSDAEIKSVCSSRLEHYKIPVFIEWRESLIRTSTGKLQRQLM